VQRAVRIEFDGGQAHVGHRLFTGEQSLDLIGEGGKLEQEVEVGVQAIFGYCLVSPRQTAIYVMCPTDHDI